MQKWGIKIFLEEYVSENSLRYGFRAHWTFFGTLGLNTYLYQGSLWALLDTHGPYLIFLSWTPLGPYGTLGPFGSFGPFGTLGPYSFSYPGTLWVLLGPLALRYLYTGPLWALLGPLALRYLYLGCLWALSLIHI